MQPSPSSVRPVVYETKPATEWILGRPVQKVSPRYTHACLQGTLFAWLRAWSRDRGRVGSEWRVWLAPEGEAERYLILSESERFEHPALPGFVFALSDLFSEPHG